MVSSLPPAGADQEHKTDEMHTALMEASMDGHVDVAKLLLDHGAQVHTCGEKYHPHTCIHVHVPSTLSPPCIGVGRM